MKNKQIAYIDESNILSKTGNSVYVCVYVEYVNKDSISQKVIEIEKNLKIQYIHWVDMPWKLRLKFAEKISNLDFNCRIVAYKNPINQRDTLMNFLIKVIDFREDIHEIFIDGKQSKIFKLKFKTMLRKNGIKVYGLSFVNDKTEPLVRLADFVAGFYRSYINNCDKYAIDIYMLLNHKIKILN